MWLLQQMLCQHLLLKANSVVMMFSLSIRCNYGTLVSSRSIFRISPTGFVRQFGHGGLCPVTLITCVSVPSRSTRIAQVSWVSAGQRSHFLQDGELCFCGATGRHKEVFRCNLGSGCHRSQLILLPRGNPADHSSR